MPKNTKQTVVLILLGLGFSMFLYGFTLRILPVYGQYDDQSLATPEHQVVLEVSRGGVIRDVSGLLRKTYTGAPPKACPT
jgi:hypothetical protein